MVSTLHGCSDDNSTIFYVKKLKTIRRFFPFFPSFTFPFFPFLFNLFCFQVYVKESIYCFSWTLKLIQTAYYFHREKERESRRSPIVRGVVGWCDGAR